MFKFYVVVKKGLNEKIGNMCLKVVLLAIYVEIHFMYLYSINSVCIAFCIFIYDFGDLIADYSAWIRTCF